MACPHYKTFPNGIHKLVKHCITCIEMQEGCVKNYALRVSCIPVALILIHILQTFSDIT